jgi:hypothetical protein
MTDLSPDTGNILQNSFPHAMVSGSPVTTMKGKIIV